MLRQTTAIRLGGLALLLLSVGSPARGEPTNQPGPTRAPSPPAVTAPANPEAYRISPGDVISVLVWGEDRLTLECPVNSSGSISYPLLGDVPARGLTSAELQTRLQDGLMAYMKRPKVVVTVRQYSTLGASVYVLGEVASQGVYALPSGGSLVQAIALAGGPTAQAGEEITLIRARTRETKTFNLEDIMAAGTTPGDASPEPGDVIMVGRKPKASEMGRYSVLGEVPAPGSFDMPLEGELRVLDAMKSAGLLPASSGPEAQGKVSAIEDQFKTADLEHVLLKRGDVVIPLNLARLLRGDTSQNLLLQQGDTITVPQRSLIRVFTMGEVRRPGKQLLPTGSTVLDLVNGADGPTQGAKQSRAVLLRLVDGTPQPVPVDLGRLLGQADPKQNLALVDGDILCVPSKTEKTQGYRDWTYLGTLLLSLGGIF